MIKQSVSAIEVAKLLLSYDPEREYFVDGKMFPTDNDETNPPTIGNFRLNKMLHICQMLHYAKYGEPLFFEDLRAFPHGGIVYPVYKGYFALYNEILKPEEVAIESQKKEFIKKNYCYFKNYHDKALETFSHDDIAWRERWKGHWEEDDDRMLIDEKVKSFYRDILGHIVREVELS